MQKPLKTPIEMFYQWEKETPNDVYLRQPVNGEWQEYSWAEVAGQVRRIASAIASLELPKGSCVAIAGRNTAHWFMADLAIQMNGLISVGLYPKQATETVNYILSHCEAKAIFIGPMDDPECITNGIPEGCTRITMPYDDVAPGDLSWKDLLAANEPMAGNPVPDLDDIFTLVYTSGTTGNPKGVTLSYRNVATAIVGASEAIELGQERLFSYLPLAHIFERLVVEMSSLYNHCVVSFLEDLKKFPVQLPQVAPSIFVAVPAVWIRMQHGILEKMPQKKLDRMLSIPILGGMVRKKILTALGLHNVRLAASGAAPISVSTLEWWHKMGITIHEGYAMSENTAYAFINRPGKHRFGSVGQAVPNSEAMIAEDGEILTRSDATMLGYYKQPDKTAEDIDADGWLHTGDRGRIDEDGYLYITGRVKDIFKTEKGKYVAPAPIEGKFGNNSDIEALCMIGAGLKQPVLVVSLSEDGRSKDRAAVEASLLASLKEVNATLEAHELISSIGVCNEPWTIDNGLLTPTMKIKRNEVEDRYGDLVQQCVAAGRDKVVWQ